MAQKLYQLSLEELSGKAITVSEKVYTAPTLLRGKLQNILLETLYKKARGMKVAAVFSESSYAIHGALIKHVFSFSQSEVTECILKSVTLEPKTFAPLFCFSNDYRLILAVGEDCFNAAAYFASSRKLPIIFLPTIGEFYPYFSDYVFTENGGVISRLFAPCEKTFLFCDELIPKFANLSIADTAAAAFCYLLGMFDVVCDSALNGTIRNTESEDLLKYAVNGFLRLETQADGYLDTYLDLAVKMALSELLAGEHSVIFTAPFKCAAAEGKREQWGLQSFAYADKLYKLYEIYFSYSFIEYPNVPDYLADIDGVSRLTKIKSEDLLRLSMLDAKAAFGREKELGGLKAELLNELKKLRNAIDAGAVRIGKLSGEKFGFKAGESTEKAIKCAAYSTQNSIMLKLLRDSGMLNFVTLG